MCEYLCNTQTDINVPFHPPVPCDSVLLGSESLAVGLLCYLGMKVSCADLITLFIIAGSLYRLWIPMGTMALFYLFVTELSEKAPRH